MYTSITYSDVEILTSACNRKIVRTWEYYQWACGEVIGENSTQIIELKDNQAPVIVCPENQTVAALSDCGSMINIPMATATDDCNEVLRFKVTHPSGFSFENGGTSELPVGESILTYIAYDGCDNSSSCQTAIIVVYETLPVVVCDASTVITLNQGGISRVPAIVFDDGSLDACDELMATVVRMAEVNLFQQIPADTFIYSVKFVEISKVQFLSTQDPIDGLVINGTTYISQDDLYRPAVQFCCSDAATTQLVRFRVSDPASNNSLCMVSAEIRDIAIPEVNCPSDVTVNCNADLSDLSFFGTAFILGNCNVTYPVAETIDTSLNRCGLGQLVRNFTISDLSGTQLAACVQKIVVEPVQELVSNDIVWPEDFEAACSDMNLEPSDLVAPFDAPVLPDGCYMLEATHEDRFFTFDEERRDCGKIVREWTVIDWCNEVNGVFVEYKHSQTIVIENSDSPIIVQQDDLEFFAQSPDCNEVVIDVTRTATDDCTSEENLVWSGILIAPDGTQTVFNGNSLEGTFAIGIHQVLWSVLDGCDNRTSQTQNLDLLNTTVPVALCNSSLSINVDLVTGIALLSAVSIDANSFHPCGSDVALSFGFDMTATQTEQSVGSTDG